ncbi:low temperature requirement protein A [Rothia koreensis]|uniref:low temperature requirement protein A n=1 Tax=Rothia koreensis TaxID=592378 RepID=UPI003FCDEA33
MAGLYRIMTLVQMAGVLPLAAGSTRAMESYDFTLVTIGYVVMRLAMVTQWIRADVTNTEFRATAFHYAVAITVVQVAWVARLTLPPEAGMVGLFALALAEVAVPI